MPLERAEAGRRALTRMIATSARRHTAWSADCGLVAALTDANFPKHVIRNHIPVVQAFRAPRCGPCKTTAPQYAKAAIRLEPRLRLAQVNTEAEQALGARHLPVNPRRNAPSG